MQQKLLAEFPSVTYEAWRAQVERDLKGADFEKRLLTRTLEGIVVQPLYTARDVSALPDGSSARRVLGAAVPAGLTDLRVEVTHADLSSAAAELSEAAAAGATSLWLRFDARTRTGDQARAQPDGLACEDLAAFAQLFAGIDLSRVGLSIDAGGNVALSALLLAHLDSAGVDRSALHGTLGCDPLGALARDGRLPWDLPRARVLLAELSRYSADTYPQLRAAEVATDAYHLAGASGVQELAYAWATGAEYLRWNLAAGLDIERASAQIGFRVTVASDLFLELAKLRALRLGWAKIVAAYGGSAAAQQTQVHALTSLRTKTRRDPWVNMLRTTTEAFAALVGGANAVTTRAFDVALGRSDAFARRIARNVQVILNEEAHVTQVADAAGGSYYVESLTDQLARSAWTQFQAIERSGGMSAALTAGTIASEIEATTRLRNQAVAKRVSPILGVSEYANLTEEPVRRERESVTPPLARVDSSSVVPSLPQPTAAAPSARIQAAIAAAKHTGVVQLTAALAAGSTHANIPALPVHPSAEAFEALRDRAEKAAQAGPAPRAFLCNLGPIPKHKARAAFATNLLNAGGIAALDNDGFSSAADAVAAFKASGAGTVIICGSDDQYPEWVPQLAPALRQAGAQQIVVAGKPGDHQSAFEQAGVNAFIFMGVDVVNTLRQLLDGMGVAP